MVPPGPVPLGGGLVELARVDALLDGSIAFDVAAVREYATALVALAEDQDAFEAWARERGLGPENREPGAFVAKGWRCRACGAAMRNGDDDSACRACDNLDVTGDDWIESEFCGGWPGNLAREWAVLGNDSRAPMGRSLARLGQRILDMLEGECWWAPSAKRQPSECTGCLPDDADLPAIFDRDRSRVARAILEGRAEVAMPIYISPKLHARLACTRHGTMADLSELDFLHTAGVNIVRATTCPDCQGTGHNLRGILPPLEWSTAAVRWAEDAWRSAPDGRGTDLCEHQERILDDATDACWRLAPDQPTRVTPRGLYVLQPDTGPTGVKLRDQLRGANVWRANAASESPMQVHPPQAPHHDAHVRDWKRSKFPRWRRETST